MSSFGENLKKYREEKNMTQQNLADKLYVTRQAISRWECGARYPDLITTKKLSKILEVSVDKLLQEEDILINEDNKKITRRKITTILFIITIISRLSYTAIYLKEYVPNLFNYNFKYIDSFSIYVFIMEFISCTLLLLTVLIPIILFILHLKSKLLSKHIGLFIIIFLLIQTWGHFSILIKFGYIFDINILEIIYILFIALNIIIAYKYFCTNKIKSPIPVYICIFINLLTIFSKSLFIYTFVNENLINIENYNMLLYYAISILPITAKFSVFALLYYITHLLSIERIINNT